LKYKSQYNDEEEEEDAEARVAAHVEERVARVFPRT